MTKIRRKAAEGDTMAQTALGTWYFNGFNVVQDYEEALRWFRKAAEQGHKLSHICIYQFFHDGDKIGINKDEILTWWRMRAQQGDASAQEMLKEFR